MANTVLKKVIALDRKRVNVHTIELSPIDLRRSQDELGVANCPKCYPYVCIRMGSENVPWQTLAVILHGVKLCYQAKGEKLNFFVQANKILIT